MNQFTSKFSFFASAFFAFAIIGCGDVAEPENIAKATQTQENYSISQLTNFQPIVKELIINGSSERWTLQITEGQKSFFRSFEKTISYETSEFMPDGTIKLNGESGELLVKITEEDCSREERTKSTPLSAEFTLDGDLMNGCGAWKVDSRILGRWKLNYLQGHEMTDSLFKRGYPEFILKGRNIMGQAGCNQFRATFSSKQNEFYIAQVMMTKMSCSLIKVEQDVMRYLQQSPALFRTDGESLEFVDESGTVLMRYLKNEE